MLTEVDRVDHVLETEEVGLAPHDLLLADPDPPVVDNRVRIQFAERVEATVGVGVGHGHVAVVDIEVDTAVAAQVEVGRLLYHLREARHGGQCQTAALRQAGARDLADLLAVLAVAERDLEVLGHVGRVDHALRDQLADTAGGGEAVTECEIEAAPAKTVIGEVEHAAALGRGFGRTLADTVRAEVARILNDVVFRTQDGDESQFVEDTDVGVLQCCFYLQPLNPLTQVSGSGSDTGPDLTFQETFHLELAPKGVDRDARL